MARSQRGVSMRGRLTHQHIDDLEIQRIQRAIAVVIKFVGGNRTISGDDEPVVDHHIGAIQVAIRALSGGNQRAEIGVFVFHFHDGRLIRARVILRVVIDHFLTSVIGQGQHGVAFVCF